MSKPKGEERIWSVIWSLWLSSGVGTVSCRMNRVRGKICAGWLQKICSRIRAECWVSQQGCSRTRGQHQLYALTSAEVQANGGLWRCGLRPESLPRNILDFPWLPVCPLDISVDLAHQAAVGFQPGSPEKRTILIALCFGFSSALSKEGSWSSPSRAPYCPCLESLISGTWWWGGWAKGFFDE